MFNFFFFIYVCICLHAYVVYYPYIILYVFLVNITCAVLSLTGDRIDQLLNNIPISTYRWIIIHLKNIYLPYYMPVAGVVYTNFGTLWPRHGRFVHIRTAMLNTDFSLDNIIIYYAQMWRENDFDFMITKII